MTAQADASTYLALAKASASSRDHHAALAAVQRVLELEPRNLTALILKADQLAALGDERTASSFYRAALDLAPDPREMPASMRDESEADGRTKPLPSHLPSAAATLKYDVVRSAPRVRGEIAPVIE